MNLEKKDVVEETTDDVLSEYGITGGMLEEAEKVMLEKAGKIEEAVAKESSKQKPEFDLTSRDRKTTTVQESQGLGDELFGNEETTTEESATEENKPDDTESDTDDVIRYKKVSASEILQQLLDNSTIQKKC